MFIPHILKVLIALFSFLLIIPYNILPNLHHTTITTSPLPQGKKKKRNRKTEESRVGERVRRLQWSEVGEL